MKAISFFVGLTLLPLAALAVPAKPGIMSVRQPDGTELSVRLVGDENYHYYLTDDGYPLVNSAGYYYYGRVQPDGTIVSTDVRASRPGLRTAAERSLLAAVDISSVATALDRTASRAPRRNLASTASSVARAKVQARVSGTTPFPKGPGLFPGTAFPSSGEQKALVILVEYKDVKFTLDNPHDYFSRLLNEPGFSDYGGTGSAADYFRECSSGAFQPEFDVFGPVTLSQNMVFYGGNASGNDANPAMMVIEACEQLDAAVDFSQYDRDNDGYIDNVFVFYAGRGEATGGGADTVWPHSWGITSAYSTKRYIYDGVTLDHYACSNEWEEGHPDGVGTFVHEFSHVMGLPDLYTTAYTNAFTPGNWSAMDYGPYNNEGRTPPLYGAYERYALGWMAPAVVDGPMDASLPPISTNVAGIIRTESDYEFFLLENRQQSSWDTYIPGHGMLIWHIDYNITIWNENTVNNSLLHQYVDIEEADNVKNAATRDGDTFPGYNNVTSFTDDTTPSMRTWNGTALNLPLTDIAESADGMITFKVAGGLTPPDAVNALEADEITDLGFTACWEAVDPAAEYVISIFTRDNEGALAYLSGYYLRPVGRVTRFAVTDVDADTEYFYVVQTARGLALSAPSNEVSVYTAAATIRRERPVVLEADEVSEGTFTAHWEPLAGANGYLISVFTKAHDGQDYTGCDFTDGVSSMPRGWTSSSNSTFANSAYSGAAIPSLRLSADDRLNINPGDDIRSISFWHRGSSTSEGDVIAVYAVTDNVMTEVASVPVVSAKGGATSTVDSFPAGTAAVRLVYRRSGTKGSVAIDDVTVGYGYTYQPHYVDGYQDKLLGDVTSCKVDGLDPDTEYFYTVKATDGELVSRPSVEVRVRTQADSGVGNIACQSAVSVAVDGRTVSVRADSEHISTAIYDLAGRCVAAGYGSFCTVMSGPGCYIISSEGVGAPSRTKVIVK